MGCAASIVILVGLLAQEGAPSVDAALQEVFIREAGRASASVVLVEPERRSEVRRPGLPRGIPPPSGRYHRARGPASGVVISTSGHLLTSDYMLGGDPGRIVVTGPGGSTHEATLIARNADLDLALLQVEGLEVPGIRISRGEPKVGEIVIVVGRSGPGDGIVVSTGIVSALGRKGGRAIQVDAGIHPGSLGGAILNLAGDLIAIPGLFDRRVGWNSGVGFAAPGGDAARWASEEGVEIPGREGDAAEDETLARARRFEGAVVATVERALSAFVKVGGASGVVISPEGEVLTNHHVAGGRGSWEVTFPTGERYRAKLLGTDPQGDLALLRIEGGEDFPHVPLGDAEDIRVGKDALAFGNPFGLSEGGSPSVSLGIISAIHRYQGFYGDSIQVDTPVNPGNSGGPLLNLEGEIIGICGRMAWRPEFAPRVSTGAGFAIPVTQVRNFLPILRTEGAEAAHGEIEGLDLGWEGGAVVVTGVKKDSAAEKAGFEKGDRILRAAGEPVTTPDRCRGILSTYPAGTSIRFRIRREGQVREMDASLGGRPYRGVGGRQGDEPEPFIGITYGRATLEGVEVWEVAPDSPAAKAGVKKGDRITAFRGKPAEGPLQLERLLYRSRVGEELDLEIVREGRMIHLKVKVINSLDYRPPTD